MIRRVSAISFAAGLLIAAASVAETPAGAPAGSTGLCKDGSYWSGATKQGACRGHHGVKDWYGSTGGAAAPAAASAPAPTAAPAAAASAAVPAVPAAKASTSTMAAAAGGGPGQVWVNKTSKVYHCPSDRWYGKTKNGAYMTEAEATAAGYHPERGKTCH
jgi:hypothetical protein